MVYLGIHKLHLTLLFLASNVFIEHIVWSEFNVNIHSIQFSFTHHLVIS